MGKWVGAGEGRGAPSDKTLCPQAGGRRCGPHEKGIRPGGGEDGRGTYSLNLLTTL